MKIFAVIGNYGQWESTYGDSTPFWYEMPDSSIVRSNNPFFVPDFDTQFRVFPSLCLRVGRLGKSVAPRFAHRYLDAWTMAGAAVAVDLLEKLRSRGLPWSRAVAFDRSCMLGNLQPIETLKQYREFEVVCSGSPLNYRLDSLLHSIEDLVAAVSGENTIKTGDLILAALANEGLPLKPGTRLEIKTENNLTLLGINIR